MALFQKMKNPQWEFMFGEEVYPISQEAIFYLLFASSCFFCYGICSIHLFIQISIKHGPYIKCCARDCPIPLAFKNSVLRLSL